MFKDEKLESEKRYMTLAEQKLAAEKLLEDLNRQIAAAEEEKKEAAKASRKEDAEIVKAAITRRIEGERAAKKAKLELYKKYLEECKKVEGELESLRVTEKSSLEAFCKKYGSFHDTITLDDLTYTCDYTTEGEVSETDPITKLFFNWWV